MQSYFGAYDRNNLKKKIILSMAKPESLGQIFSYLLKIQSYLRQIRLYLRKTKHLFLFEKFNHIKDKSSHI